MGYTATLITHMDISDEQINEICILKAKRWDYSLSEQRIWIINNIKPDDYHLVINDGVNAVAYANLISIKAVVNGKITELKGIGNVCTSETGLGYGNVLMKTVNSVLIQQFWAGLLFCKDRLVPYYEKFGWSLINKNDDIIDENSVNYLNYNLPVPVLSFQYDGDNF